MNIVRILFFILVIGLLTACVETEPQIEAVVSPTEADRLIETLILTPTRSSTPSPEPNSIIVEPTASATQTPVKEKADTPTPFPKIITASVNNGALALRTGPGLNYRILGTYPFGTDVIVLATEPNRTWLYVETNDGKLGWMFTNYLQIDAGILDSIPIVIATPTPESVKATATPDLEATQACQRLEKKGTPCP